MTAKDDNDDSTDDSAGNETIVYACVTPNSVVSVCVEQTWRRHLSGEWRATKQCSIHVMCPVVESVRKSIVSWGDNCAFVSTPSKLARGYL